MGNQLPLVTDLQHHTVSRPTENPSPSSWRRGRQWRRRRQGTRWRSASRHGRRRFSVPVNPVASDAPQQPSAISACSAHQTQVRRRVRGVGVDSCISGGRLTTGGGGEVVFTTRENRVVGRGGLYSRKWRGMQHVFLSIDKLTTPPPTPPGAHAALSPTFDIHVCSRRYEDAAKAERLPGVR